MGCVAAAAHGADVQLVGRFARNEGAKEFVGDWRLETTKVDLFLRGLAIVSCTTVRSCSAMPTSSAVRRRCLQGHTRGRTRAGRRRPAAAGG